MSVLRLEQAVKERLKFRQASQERKRLQPKFTKSHQLSHTMGSGCWRFVWLLDFQTLHTNQIFPADLQSKEIHKEKQLDACRYGMMHWTEVLWVLLNPCCALTALCCLLLCMVIEVENTDTIIDRFLKNLLDITPFSWPRHTPQGNLLSTWLPFWPGPVLFISPAFRQALASHHT